MWMPHVWDNAQDLNSFYDSLLSNLICMDELRTKKTNKYTDKNLSNSIYIFINY